MATSIGELVGTVSLEDRFSRGIEAMGTVVEKSLGEMEGWFGTTVLAAGAVVTAITGIAGTIVYMADQGSHILDLEKSFDRLAGGAENADGILKALNDGVADTVDKTDLLTIANKALSTGAVKSAEDFGTMAAAARVLSREGFGPVTQQLQEIERVMATGRVRQSEYLRGAVDLKSAEEAFARSLGTVRENLSPQGKLLADRAAAMDVLRKKVEDAGVVELSFSERVAAAGVKISEWFTRVDAATSASPNVTRAFDAIQNAILNAFGGDSEKALQTIIGWINKFADAVTTYGPKIVQWIVDTGAEIHNLWQTVVSAWNAVPDWFKSIAKEAAIAGGAVLIANKAINAIGLTNSNSGVLEKFSAISNVTAGLVAASGAAKGLIPYLSGIGTVLGQIGTQMIAGGPFGALKVMIGVVSGAVGELIVMLGPLGLIAAGVLAVGAALVIFRNRIDAIDAAKKTIGTRIPGMGGGMTLDEAQTKLKALNDEMERTVSLNPLPGLQITKPGAPATPPSGVPPPGPGMIDEDKIIAATKVAADRIIAIRKEMTALEDKMAGDSLRMQIARNDEWLADEIRKLQTSKALNTNYSAEVLALQRLHDDKLAEVKQKAFLADVERMQASLDMTSRSWQEDLSITEDALKKATALTQAGADDEAKIWDDLARKRASESFGGTLITRETLQTTGAIVLDMQQLNGQIGLVETKASEAGKAMDKAMTDARKAALPLTETEKQIIQLFIDSGLSAEEAFAKVRGAALNTKGVLGDIQNTLSKLADAFSKLSQIGGDSFKGIIKTGGEVIGTMSLIVGSVKDMNSLLDGPGKKSWATYAAAATDAFSIIMVGYGLIQAKFNQMIAEQDARFAEQDRLLSDFQKRMDAIYSSGRGGNSGRTPTQTGTDPVTGKALWDQTALDKQIQQINDMITKLMTMPAKNPFDMAAIAAAAAAIDAAIAKIEKAKAGASKYGMSGAELKQAAQDAFDTLQYMIDSQDYTQKQLDAAYYDWQKAMADAGDTAAAAWVKAHDAAQTAATAGNAAFDAMQKQYDDLAATVQNEAPEDVMGSIEAATRGQMAALKKKMDEAAAAQAAATQSTADTTTQTNQTTADTVDGIWKDSANKYTNCWQRANEDTTNEFDNTFNGIHTGFDETSTSAQNTADDITKAFALKFEIPVTFRVQTIPSGPSTPQGAVPMAEGGFGHATGPMLFSTRGNEDFAFSGEGRSFAGNGGGDTITVNIPMTARQSAAELVEAVRAPGGIADTVIEEIARNKRGRRKRAQRAMGVNNS